MTARPFRPASPASNAGGFRQPVDSLRATWLARCRVTGALAGRYRGQILAM
jgi:hypothetical protein